MSTAANPQRPRSQYSYSRKGIPYFRNYPDKNYVEYMPFDPISCVSVFGGNPTCAEDEDFVNAIMAYHSKLSPAIDEQQAVASLVTKITECLEAISLYPEKFPEGHIQEVRVVGSFKKGTMLAGHCSADLVVVLREMPSFLAITALGNLVENEFLAKEKDSDVEDPPEIVKRLYGFDFCYLGASIHVAFCTDRANYKNFEDSVHVTIPLQNIAQASIRHTRWAEENAVHSNVKALIRIFKDFRRRFTGFQHLTPWQIDLLSFYAVLRNQRTEPLSVSTAFRRSIQLLASGLFMPGSTGFIDPCEPPSKRVHVALELAEQEELCCAAQTMIRIIGHKKFTVIFDKLRSDELITPAMLCNSANSLPGIQIRPSEAVMSDAKMFMMDQSDSDSVTVKDEASEDNESVD